jgi:hypothetical protein
MRRSVWLFALIAGVIVGYLGVQAGDGWMVLASIWVTISFGCLMNLVVYVCSDEYRIMRRLEHIRRG